MTDSLLFDSPGNTATLSPCGRYRYTLGRRWGFGPCAGWLMLNPSTADAERDDPTIRRCVAFAKSWGCGGILVVNLFAWRSTDPAALRSAPDPVGPDNNVAILAAAERCRGLVAAWGAHPFAVARGRAVADLLRHPDRRLWSLRTTKDGHPCHPLYLPGHLTMAPFTLTTKA